MIFFNYWSKVYQISKLHHYHWEMQIINFFCFRKVMNKRVLYKFTCSYVLYTIYLQNNQKTNWLGENQYSGFALRLHSCLFIYNENQKTLEQKNDILAILVLDNVRNQIVLLLSYCSLKKGIRKYRVIEIKFFWK